MDQRPSLTRQMNMKNYKTDNWYPTSEKHKETCSVATLLN